MNKGKESFCKECVLWLVVSIAISVCVATAYALVPSSEIQIAAATSQALVIDDGSVPYAYKHLVDFVR